MLVARIDSLFDPTISLIVGFSFLIAVCYGSLLVVRGELTVGELITFTTYLGTLVWPMLAFGWLFNIMERGRASYDRVEKILSQTSDVVNKESAVQNVASGDITFAIDTFSYKKNEIINLEDIHFTLKKGETLGIVGRTGAGKRHY